MGAKDFTLKWNQENPMGVHFYLDEEDGDIVGIRIRYPSSAYKISSMQWSALKNVVFSRSRNAIVVSSSEIFSHNGAIDLIANPCFNGESKEEYDKVVLDTLSYLAGYVFPEYAK